jgi:hypothetical protein
MPERDTNATPQPARRPFPWFCPRCRKKEVWGDTVPYRTQRVREGRTVTIDIPQLTVPRCRNCGALLLNCSAEEQILKALEAQAPSADSAANSAGQAESSAGGRSAPAPPQ